MGPQVAMWNGALADSSWGWRQGDCSRDQGRQRWGGLDQDRGLRAGGETLEGTSDLTPTFQPHSPTHLSLIYGLQAQGTTFSVMNLCWPCESAALLCSWGWHLVRNNGQFSVLVRPFQCWVCLDKLYPPNSFQDLWGWFAVTGHFPVLNSLMPSLVFCWRVLIHLFSLYFILLESQQSSSLLHCFEEPLSL